MSFQSAVYGFIPTSITGCVLWMDAADSSTITLSSTAITQWNDKSSAGNNFVQATTANSPTVGTSANGLPTIYFATTNQQLVSSQNNATTGNASRTVIQVFWCPTLSSAYYSVTGTESGANPAQAWGHAKNANSDVTYPFMYSSVGNDVYTFVYSTPNPLITYAQYDSTASSLNAYYATSGATGGTTTVGNFTTKSCTLNTTAGVWYLGRRQQAATGSVTSHLLEMIHFNKVLSTTERQQVEGYLTQKWDLNLLLSSSHPGRSTTLYRSDYKKQNVMRAIPYYAAFSPRQISGCALWLDAADSSTITLSGSNVTQWNDKSINGWNVSQATSAKRPTLVSNSLNGLPGLNFIHASSQHLDTANQSSLNSLTGLSLFYVLKPTWNIDDPVQNPAFFGIRAPGGGVTIFNYYFINNYSGTALFNGAPITSHTGSSVTSAIGKNVVSLYCSTNNNGTDIAYLNGNLTGDTVTGASFGSGTNLPIIIGGDNYDPYENWQGLIYEVVFFTRVLSTTERQQVESYLAQKWGLTASLPGGHSHATQPAGAITLQSLVNKQIVRRRIVYTINWTYTIPSQANLILQVNSRNWTSSASILDSITGVAWNMTNASLNSSRNTILMSGNGLFKYNNAGAGPSGFSGTQHTVMMVYYRLANATSASKGNPPSVTLNLTGYLYTINRTPATITNQLLAGENSSWVYQSAYQVGTNQTVLDGTTGWTFIAFVYTGTALNVYLNGQPENNTNSVSNPATTTLTNNYFSIFGNPRDNNAFINGELAFYGLWNTQLTAQNILDFYNANKDQFLAFP